MFNEIGKLYVNEMEIENILNRILFFNRVSIDQSFKYSYIFFLIISKILAILFYTCKVKYMKILFFLIFT